MKYALPVKMCIALALEEAKWHYVRHESRYMLALCAIVSIAVAALFAAEYLDARDRAVHAAGFAEGKRLEKAACAESATEQHMLFWFNGDKKELVRAIAPLCKKIANGKF